jgi:hypothetical protein
MLRFPGNLALAACLLAISTSAMAAGPVGVFTNRTDLTLILTVDPSNPSPGNRFHVEAPDLPRREAGAEGDDGATLALLPIVLGKNESVRVFQEPSGVTGNASHLLLSFDLPSVGGKPRAASVLFLFDYAGTPQGERKALTGTAEIIGELWEPGTSSFRFASDASLTAPNKGLELRSDPEAPAKRLGRSSPGLAPEHMSLHKASDARRPADMQLSGGTGTARTGDDWFLAHKAQGKPKEEANWQRELRERKAAQAAKESKAPAKTPAKTAGKTPAKTAGASQETELERTFRERREREGQK